MTTFLEEIGGCSNNSICVVEKFKVLVDKGYSPTQEEVRYVSALIGEPTRRLEVFNGRYIDVFTRMIEKNCYYADDKSLCIYSWSPRVPVRYFPVSLDATGTVLLLQGDDVRLVAYPTHRTHDIEGRNVEIPDPERVSIVEVTRRVDGYQVTFYYNPLLGRWTPATRYVLHNMRYVRNRLVVEEIDKNINPYTTIAEHLAVKGGLYSMLGDLRGWTFTFILEAPEPAILRPNVELYDYESFKLHLLNARAPDGRLLTTKESAKLIPWVHVPVEDVTIRSAQDLKRLIEEWSRDLKVRSRFVRYSSPDSTRPYTIEVRSKLYENAVLVKHASDPKSFIVLASYGLEEEAVELLVDYRDLKTVGREICELYRDLKSLVTSMINDPTLSDTIEKFELPRDLLGELEKARRSGDVDRFVRKLSASLSGESMHATKERLRSFIEALKKRARSLDTVNRREIFPQEIRHIGS